MRLPEMTRRRFLAALPAITIAAPFLWQQAKDIIFDDNLDFSAELKNFPDTRFYYHNAASSPYLLQKALESSVPNIEIDVINYSGRLYTAHGLEEFEQMDDKQQQEQTLENIIQSVVNSGKNPAFDLKINQEDQAGFDRFISLVNGLVPKDRLVTFSGKSFNLLEQITNPADALVLYTVDGSSALSEYLSLQERLGRQKDGPKRGATVRIDSPVLAEILEFNRQNGLETNIWPVDKRARVIDLLRKGANGITSNNRQLLQQATRIF